ncbi:MAG: TonB-dependent receptor, partial [Acidobacteria bacterium]|nr:TonB-dependent receptor [Acidobacteriota bacterium]
HDEWQARQNLSIAAGLRYDWQNYFGDRNNVSPRLALAWAPGGARKTVVRAGAGYFFERSGPGPIWDILRFDGARLKRYVVSDPAPAWLGPATGLPAASVARLEPGVELPETLQFSVGLERQLAKKTTLAVNYVGTRGIHQLRSRDANAPLPPLFAARPDARVNVLRLIEAAGRVEGNALEVTLRGAIAPRVAGLAQYTFGRTMSDTGGVNWFPAASFAPDGEWGRADGDRRHQFNLLANATLHRWLNLGISASLLSGQPFNVTTGGDQNRDGLASDRPPALGRNTGKGPGQVALDLRWYREFRLRPEAGEKGPMIVVSLDAFNLPNRVNYQNYLGALSSPFFGRPVATLPARRLQAAARFQF